MKSSTKAKTDPSKTVSIPILACSGIWEQCLSILLRNSYEKASVTQICLEGPKTTLKHKQFIKWIHRACLHPTAA